MIDNQKFVSSKSKRRSFKKKFKKFIEKANKLYEELDSGEDHLLDDDRFDKQM